MAKSKGLQYCPIFEKEGNQLIICRTDFLATSENSADRIGISAISECVSYDIRYTGKTVEVSKGMRHVAADLVRHDLKTLKVGIISGPLFDKVKQREIVQ